MRSTEVLFRCAFLTIVLLAISSAAPSWKDFAAEKAGGPDLDKILRQLEVNFFQYHASIPSFFCDEHVISGVRRTGVPLEVTRTSSIFRLKRYGSGKSAPLIESRQIKTVDGKPAKDTEKLHGPAVLSGAFNIATAMVAYSEKACFNYHLVKSRKHNQYIIEYATKNPKEQGKLCTVKEPTKGRAFIDSNAMQITRIEARTWDHPMPGNVTGLWIWSVDYGAVSLNGKTFWLPKRIESFADSDRYALEWTFDATYSNYHEMTVSSRIIP
ncbi:MAG TPA: hypothetical protein VFE38_01130 [Edaphobacter sp.]|nr:hypothetical protein [Edaphobacter sp.]